MPGNIGCLAKYAIKNAPFFSDRIIESCLRNYLFWEIHYGNNFSQGSSTPPSGTLYELFQDPLHRNFTSNASAMERGAKRDPGFSPRPSVSEPGTARRSGADRAGHRRTGTPRILLKRRFPGHLRCGCGRQLTGQKKKGKYVYYTHKCQHTGKKEAIREEVVFANLDQAIRDFRFSPAFASNMKILFQHVGDIRRQNVDSERNEISDNIAYIEEKKSRVYDLFLERDIDRALLRKKIDELDQQIARLENGRQSFAMDNSDLMIRACDLIDSLDERPSAFLASGDYGKKAEILRSMSEQVTMSNDSATIAWKTPYNHLMEPAFQDLKKSCDQQENATSQEEIPALEPAAIPDREAANTAIPIQKAACGGQSAQNGSSPVLLFSPNLTFVELSEKVEMALMEMRIHFGGAVSA